jgi:fructose-bisphosphate aldolase class I
MLHSTQQANGLACQAKYVAGSIPSFAADKSLFVKAHAY